MTLLQVRNKEYFGQSKGCTWTSPPTDFTMEFSATSLQAEAILNGTFLQHTNQASAHVETHRIDEGVGDNSLMAPTGTQDETDSQETAAHLPLHF